jgi:hypothetical protein
VHFLSLFLDIEEFKLVDVLFAYQSTTCEVMGAERGCLGQGWKLERDSWVRDQSIHSMGPVWREVCILAQRVTTPGNGFL